MPIFRFMLHGTGIQVRGEAGGFFATRWVRALSVEKATDKVVELVQKEWTSGASSHLSPDHPPTKITVEDCRRIRLREAIMTPNRGSTIYSGESAPDR